MERALRESIFRFPKRSFVLSKLPKLSNPVSLTPFNRSPRTRTGSHEAWRRS